MRLHVCVCLCVFCMKRTQLVWPAAIVTTGSTVSDVCAGTEFVGHICAVAARHTVGQWRCGSTESASCNWYATSHVIDRWRWIHSNRWTAIHILSAWTVWADAITWIWCIITTARAQHANIVMALRSARYRYPVRFFTLQLWNDTFYWRC